MVSEGTHEVVMKHSDQLNSAMIYDRDFDLSYFGFKTLEKSYLLRIKRKVVERPQHLFMRVAVGMLDIYYCVSTIDICSLINLQV